MASASECMHKPGTPNTIIHELHPMALLYILRGVRSHAPINSFMEVAGSVTKLKEGCFGPRSNENLLFMKRSLVLAATIQLSPSA